MMKTNYIIYCIYVMMFTEIIVISILISLTKTVDPNKKSILNHLKTFSMIINLALFIKVYIEFADINQVLNNVSASYIYARAGGLAFLSMLSIFLWGMCLFRNNHIIEKYSNEPIVLDNSKIAVLEEELESIKTDRSKKMKKINSLESALKIKNKELDDIQLQWHIEKKNNSHLETKLQKLSEQLKEEQNNSKNQKDIIDSLKTFQEESKDKISKLTNEQKENEMLVRNLKQEILNYQKLIADKNLIMNGLEKRVSKLQRENKSLNEKSSNQDKQVFNLSEMLSQKSNEIDELNSIVLDSNQQLENMNKLKKDLSISEKRIVELEKQLDAEKKYNQKQKETIHSLSQYQNENIDQISIYKEKISKSSNHIKKLEMDLLVYQEQVGQYNQKIQKLNDDIVRFKNEKKDIYQSSLKTEKKLREVTKAVEQKEGLIRELNDTILNLKEKYSLMETKAKELEEQIGAMNANKTNLERVIEKNKTPKGKIRQEINQDYNKNFVSVFYDELKKKKGE